MATLNSVIKTQHTASNSSLFKYLLSLFLVLSLAACSSESDAPYTQADIEVNPENDDTVSSVGRVVKGVISHALIQVYPIVNNNGTYEIDFSAPPVSTQTDSKGYYQVKPSNRWWDSSYYYLVMVSDENTRMLCDLDTGCESGNGKHVEFGDQFNPVAGFTLSNIVRSRWGRIYHAPINPLTHLAIKHASILPGGYSPENINIANQFIENKFALGDKALRYTPSDLTQLSSTKRLRTKALKMGLISAAFMPYISNPEWDNMATLPLDEIILGASQLANYLSTDVSSSQLASTLSTLESETYEHYASLNVSPLVIHNHPVSMTVNEGDRVELTVSAVSSDSISYQWLKDGNVIPGETEASLYLNSAVIEASGVYSVIVTSGNDIIESLSALLTVEPLPPVEPPPAPLTIVQQPESVSATEGDSVTLNISASGPEVITYQWLKNGSAISGATSTSLSFSTIKLNAAGSYSVRISSGNETLESLNALIHVEPLPPVEPPPTPLTIVQQPEPLTATEGDAISFSVIASGPEVISYQWLKNGSAISGASNTSLNLSNIDLNAAGAYSVRVSSGTETIESLSAMLSVNTAPVPVVIVQHPQSVVATEGDTVSLEVIAQGDGPLEYQWQKGGSVLANETASQLQLSPVSLADQGTYSVTVSNNVNVIQSGFANVSVLEKIDPIVIQAQPVSTAVNEGNAVTFSVTATGGGFISYQWRKNGQAIPNAYSDTFSINSANIEDAGSYDVVLANSVGNLNSHAALLTIIPAIDESITIVQQPQAFTVNEGDPTRLSVSATSEIALGYQWLKDGNEIAGATNDYLTLVSSQTSDQGSYTVIVSNGINSVLSEPALLTVTPTPVVTPVAISLSWDIPDSRVDGSMLYLSDILGYKVIYGTDGLNLNQSMEISGGDTTEARIDLMPDTYYFSIATLDVDGSQSAFSETISIIIE